MKLYEIKEGLINVANMLDMEEVEPEMLEIAKKELIKALENKSEGIVHIIRNMNSKTEMISLEVARLQDLKKKEEKKIKRLKDMVQNTMEDLNTRKIDTNLGNISLRKGSGSVIIDDLDKIPEQLVKETVTKIPDKKAIKIELKKGEKIEGVHLEVKDSLIIPK